MSLNELKPQVETVVRIGKCSLCDFQPTIDPNMFSSPADVIHEAFSQLDANYQEIHPLEKVVKAEGLL